MTTLTVKEGLRSSSGDVVNGAYISSMGPDEIIYTGKDASERILLEKWARKGNRKFSTSNKPEPKVEPKVELKVEPKEDTENTKDTPTDYVKDVEDVKASIKVAEDNRSAIEKLTSFL